MIRNRSITDHRGRPSRWARRGSLLPELVISAVMIAAAMSLTVNVVSQAVRQRRAADQRQRAILEAGNLMERITALPYDEVTVKRARGISVSPTAAASLPGVDLAVEIADEPPGPQPSVKRVAIRLRWKGRSGEWEAPVRLTTWIQRRRPTP